MSESDGDNEIKLTDSSKSFFAELKEGKNSCQDWETGKKKEKRLIDADESGRLFGPRKPQTPKRTEDVRTVEWWTEKLDDCGGRHFSWGQAKVHWYKGIAVKSK